VLELSRPFWIPLSFQIWEYPEYPPNTEHQVSMSTVILEFSHFVLTVGLPY